MSYYFMMLSTLGGSAEMGSVQWLHCIRLDNHCLYMPWVYCSCPSGIHLAAATPFPTALTVH
jgi:hypothetical protein